MQQRGTCRQREGGWLAPHLRRKPLVDGGEGRAQDVLLGEAERDGAPEALAEGAEASGEQGAVHVGSRRVAGHLTHTHTHEGHE